MSYKLARIYVPCAVRHTQDVRTHLNTLEKVYGGLTESSAYGRWQGDAEGVQVIEVIVPQLFVGDVTIPNEVLALAQTLKGLGEECVLVCMSEVHASFL